MMAQSTTGLPSSDHNCVSMGLAIVDQCHGVIIVIIIDAMIIVFTKWLDLNFEFDYILIFWKLPTVFHLLVCKLDHLILV